MSNSVRDGWKCLHYTIICEKYLYSCRSAGDRWKCLPYTTLWEMCLSYQAGNLGGKEKKKQFELENRSVIDASVYLSLDLVWIEKENSAKLIVCIHACVCEREKEIVFYMKSKLCSYFRSNKNSAGSLKSTARHKTCNKIHHKHHSGGMGKAETPAAKDTTGKASIYSLFQLVEDNNWSNWSLYLEWHAKITLQKMLDSDTW